MDDVHIERPLLPLQSNWRSRGQKESKTLAKLLDDDELYTDASNMDVSHVGWDSVLSASGMWSWQQT